MRAKKNPKADLESKKALFIQLGLVVAISVSILAFEYRSYDQKESVIIHREVVNLIDDIVDITQEEPQMEEPEKIVEPTTTFDVVDDNKEIKKEWTIKDFLGDKNIVIEPKKIIIEVPDEVIKDEDDKVFVWVQEEAEFPGGYVKLQEFLAQTIVYPRAALETGAEGTVTLSFVVEKDGSITNIKVLRDAGSGLGEEAIRVVKVMPKWNPAKQRTKTVRQQFTLPITFKLRK